MDFQSGFMLPDPDGTVDADDRIFLTGLYTGLVASAPVAVKRCAVFSMIGALGRLGILSGKAGAA